MVQVCVWESVHVPGPEMPALVSVTLGAEWREEG